MQAQPALRPGDGPVGLVWRPSGSCVQRTWTESAMLCRGRAHSWVTGSKFDPLIAAVYSLIAMSGSSNCECYLWLLRVLALHWLILGNAWHLFLSQGLVLFPLLICFQLVWEGCLLLASFMRLMVPPQLPPCCVYSWGLSGFLASRGGNAEQRSRPDVICTMHGGDKDCMSSSSTRTAEDPELLSQVVQPSQVDDQRIKGIEGRKQEQHGSCHLDIDKLICVNRCRHISSSLQFLYLKCFHFALLFLAVFSFV